MHEQDLSDALRAQVSQAAASHTCLNITGGGSKSFLGCRFEGEAIHVGAHAGIVEYEPNELVLTARAGTRIEAIDSALADNDQALGFEPPRFSPQSTIGGTLACNVSGPARPWHGSVRDAVLGIRLINGRGEHLRFGGRVIKNVAGFDVARLQAGAFGSLGLITEVSMKVLPRPEKVITVVHQVDAPEAVRQMNVLAGSAAPVSGAAWLAGRQYIRLSGAARSVDAALKSIGGECVETDIWSRLRDRNLALFTAADPRPLWRLSVKSTSDVLLDEAGLLIDWAGAQRFARMAVSLDEMSRIAAAAGGHAMRLSHNDSAEEFLQPPGATAKRLHERLKKSFDPAGVFNRGRLYDWL